MVYPNTFSSSQMTWQFRLISTSNICFILQSLISFFRVTRTLFAFAEMTNMDPNYEGPEFDFDVIIKDLMLKVWKELQVKDLKNIFDIPGNKKEVIHTRYKQCTNKYQLNICQSHGGSNTSDIANLRLNFNFNFSSDLR